jgi:hypothetical protein
LVNPTDKFHSEKYITLGNKPLAFKKKGSHAAVLEGVEQKLWVQNSIYRRAVNPSDKLHFKSLLLRAIRLAQKESKFDLGEAVNPKEKLHSVKYITLGYSGI